MLLSNLDYFEMISKIKIALPRQFKIGQHILIKIKGLIQVYCIEKYLFLVMLLKQWIPSRK